MLEILVVELLAFVLQFLVFYLFCVLVAFAILKNERK